MDKTSLNAINKFFYFSMNYPHDFIEKVWSDDIWLAKHLRNKFEVQYIKHGSYGVVNAFYGELDWNNRIKLMNWVMNNYNDEQNVYYGE